MIEEAHSILWYSLAFSTAQQAPTIMTHVPWPFLKLSQTSGISFPMQNFNPHWITLSMILIGSELNDSVQ